MCPGGDLMIDAFGELAVAGYRQRGLSIGVGG